MTTESKSVITAALDTLTLFNLMAEDFQPRNLKQICELAQRLDFTWSQTKIFNMLETLAAGQFMRQADSGEWSISPHVTAIAVAFQQSINRRSAALLAQVAEIQIATQERIK